MQTDLDELRITSSQLEKITGLEITEISMGKAYRPTIFRSTKRFLSFLLAETLTLGLILIFCLPVSLVLARGLGILTTANTIPFLLTALGISITLFAGWNGLIWKKSKALKTLAHLLEDVDKHNEIIDAVKIIDELGSIESSTIQVIDREAVLTALTATRESLLNALMTEKILRKHQQFIARRQDLFANIETNLITLQTLQTNQQANEYSQLLNEALQIGMSIRQEMEQFDRKN